MLKVILGILGALTLSIASAECHEAAGWLSSRIVRLAARRLPKRLREVREEEWLAELDAFEGLRILKLAWSLGVLFAAIRLRFRYRGEHKAERSHRFFPTYKPGPEVIVATRRHPAILLGSITMTLGGLLTAIVYTFLLTSVPFLVAIWVLWLFVALKHLWELRRWYASLYELTPNQLSLPYWPHGKFTCRVCPSYVSRIVVERNALGRLLDFATFRIEGPEGVHIMRFVPYPEQLILDLENWLPQPTVA